jgi:Mitochondrial ribosomal protein subunit
MASKRLSPAANLLRRSKLFSLPPPLRPPPPQNPASRNERYSETATLPYPTHAAIETTPRGVRVGEWGLKRSLPPKAGRTSTPMVRIRALDNADHITDYNSAADHALTLEKWQEMDIPLSLNQPRDEQNTGILSRDDNAQSVFEENLHSTASTDDARDSKHRWRFHGPWIIGMNDMDFEQYIEKSLRGRRSRFLSYLRRHLTDKKAQAARSVALMQGNPSLRRHIKLTDTEFVNTVRKLREERLELWGLMWTFLDIPGDPPTIDSSNPNYAALVSRMLGDTDEAPPQTHPSAGLAYSRSGNHLYNHPSLGPQRTRPPIHARIIQHGNVGRPTRGGSNSSLFGVGGVVGTEATESFGFVENSRAGEHRFDAEVEGGGKTWVIPKRAAIESSGRIKLEVERANADTVAVWEHKLPPGTAFDRNDPLSSLASAEYGDRMRKGALR